MAAQSVDEFIVSHPTWEAEIKEMQKLLLSAGLKEEIKWGMPVYTFNDKNIAGIGAFKNHCAIWFYQGALLEDRYELLENVQEGKTRALRQIKFTKGEDIPVEKLSSYIAEAVKNQEEGKEIKPLRNEDVLVPSHLKAVFQEDPALEISFQQLSPGRQREYCEFIGDAKRADTRERRLEKIAPMIKEGKGLNE